MPSQRERNNVRAGIFVTITILLGVFTIITLTDLWTTLTRATREYTVRFHVADGIASIESGAKVLVGGVDLGSVVAVEPRFDPDGPFREIDVRFEVDERVVLFADAKITVATSLIGAEAWLEIATVGTEGVPQDDLLHGIPPGGLLGSFLSPEIAIRTQEIVTDVAATAESARNITAKIEGNVDPAVTDVRETIANARETSEEIRDRVREISDEWLPPQLERADSIMAWAENATEQVDTVLEEGRLLMTDSRAGVADVRSMIDENRDKVQSTIDNAEASTADVRAMTERARGEMMDRIDTILASGERALDQAEATIVDARTAMRGWTPVVDDTLADARLSTQQLKLALVEIRRSPWKVLYRPTTDELEHELLYEAARSFAIAAADLKGASQSIERIFEAYPERVAEDEETLTYLREQLADRVDRYDEAQSRLFDVLNIEQ